MGGLQRVIVAGAGLAGVSAVRALREQGFAGEIIQLGDEPHRPYDRPPLSKEFLAGDWDVDRLALTGPEDAALDADLRLGTTVHGLDLGSRAVLLRDGTGLPFDGLVIATGARARTLPAQHAPGAPTSGVFTLRSLDDALALRSALAPGVRLVVVGAGFLGSEVASTAAGRGCSVTVVEAAPVPLAGVFGAEAGARCAALHAEHGVRLLTGVQVTALLPDGAGAVRWVVLDDGTRLEADVVLVAVGAVPAVGWTAGGGGPVIHGGPRVDGGPVVEGGPVIEGGLVVDGGLLVDDEGRTSVPGVVAVGDCAARRLPVAADGTTGAARPRAVAGQHWTEALQAPARAVAALLGEPPPQRPPIAELSYVWSHQYGVMIQLAGRARPGDRLAVLEGDLPSGAFAGVLRQGPEGSDPIIGAGAVLAMNRPRTFTRLRKELAAAMAARRPDPA